MKDKENNVSLVEKHALKRLQKVENNNKKAYQKQNDNIKFSQIVVILVLIIVVLIMLGVMF